MISEQNLKAIKPSRTSIFFKKFSSFLIFIISLILFYEFGFTYSEKTQLINDKLIDVSSIFFGVFLGCLYLFEKFKTESTYQDFMRFCKKLLYLNVIIIALSFIVILIGETIPEVQIVSINKHVFEIKLRVLLFSIYLSLFTVTLYQIWRFIKMILIILRVS